MTADIAPLRDNPTLAKFLAALNEMYGLRLERIVLFGSQARGDARPDSDYDVAVFLNGSEKTLTGGPNWTSWPRCASNSLMKPALFSMRNPIGLPSIGNGRRSCMKSAVKGLRCDPGS